MTVTFELTVTLLNEVRQCALDVLTEIQVRHTSVSNVRGKGLTNGVEIMKDKSTKEPNEEHHNMVESTAFEYGLLLLGCGKSVIRLAQPLSIDG